MRSLPPPMRSFSAYSSSDQRTGRPNSAKVWLKAGRWPWRSVSASTPSQSKIRAAHQALPALPNSVRCRSAIAFTAARWSRKSDGGSYLLGFASRKARVESR